MPLFMSESEFREVGNDVSIIVRKADAYIRDLLEQLETLKAQNDANTITAEQNCALLEQKYMSLSSHFQQLESEKCQLSAALEKRATEVAQAQAQIHRLELAAMKKDSEIERLSVEINELHKSKRELLDHSEQKTSQLSEKSLLIKSYLDKIVALTDERGILEAKLRECEAELSRSQSTQSRLSQEKELLEKHNAWLNEELTSKIDAGLRQHQASAEVEAELSSKLAEAEKKFSETLESSKHYKERVKELEEKLSSTRQELQSTKEDAAVKEGHLSAEVATASKLAELYKQSSEEANQKAKELEGVMKALETHLKQLEDDYNQKLEKEALSREELVKEASHLREQLEKVQAESENCKNKGDSALLLEGNFSKAEMVAWSGNTDSASELQGDGKLVPKFPEGISATALAASLLRDGLSLAQMYSKYQEAVDAYRHERQGHRQTQAILERVLHEIEEKAEVIMDERAEHARMIDAYAVMEEKLKQSVVDQADLESSILEVKAELRKKERECGVFEKEIQELQHEVTVLLKECRDIQVRYGGSESSMKEDVFTDSPDSDDQTYIEKVPYKNIRELVEQNHQLRHYMHSQGQREQQLKEAFERELELRTNDATAKVALVLKKSEEQSALIESLQGTLGMFRRLYEEEVKTRTFFESNTDGYPEGGRNDAKKLMEVLQATAEKAKEEAAQRVHVLEDELKGIRQEIHSIRAERDRLLLEANYARERLTSFMKESENQRNEMNNILARNVEFSHLITEYQRKLREGSQSTMAAEERVRKLSVEVSILEREKEILSNAEKRASEEVMSLSEKVHRLQASLDTIKTVDEVHESSRMEERKRLEEKLNHLQREWAEAKQELQKEREHTQNLTFERDQTVKQAMMQVESISNKLADALNSVSTAEARALAAEARCSDLEANIKKLEDKAAGKSIDLSDENQVVLELQNAREEIDRLKEELQASNNHREQYKSIAQANEEALRQIENAHSHFKNEAEKLKSSLEEEVCLLNKKLADMESDIVEKEIAANSIKEEKDRIIENLSKEISTISDERNLKMKEVEEAQIYSNRLKEDLEKEHENYRAAQHNYERQVLLQAQTIQELTKTSESLAKLQEEVLELRKSSNSLKDEYESSKVSWEMEKASLEASKREAEEKLKEVDEQNKILLDRLEAMHIKIAEKERAEMGLDSQCQIPRQQGEEDLQAVIRYLRRSKETAETEISLLNQERMRLRKQLESALLSSEMAQSALRKERESARNAIYTDEEFRSLQSQVTELNLLRESNIQLREENKKNFDECQELRKKFQNAESELDKFSVLVREKEVEIDAAQKELEMQKSEIGRWQNRVSELLEKFRSVDVEDYENVKNELQQFKEKCDAMTTEVESQKKMLEEKQEAVNTYQHETLARETKLKDMEKRLQEASTEEATIKAEVDRWKRQYTLQKRRMDSLVKERDDWNKEKQSLIKQIEDLKSNTGKRVLGDLSKQQEAIIRQEMASQHEQALKDSELVLKEREARIQILEKTLEREREELRKEKDDHRKERERRVRNQKSFLEMAQKVVSEKNVYLHEYQRIKSLQGPRQEASSTQTDTTALDEKATTYFSAVDHLEDLSNCVSADSLVTEVATSGTVDTLAIVPSTSGMTSSSVSTIGKASQNAPSPSSSVIALSTAAPAMSTAVAPVRQTQRPPLASAAVSQYSSPLSRTTAGVASSGRGIDEKDQKPHLFKTAVEERDKSRKGGRKIIRPRIEPTVETEVGTEMETDAAEEAKPVVPADSDSQASIYLANSATVPSSDPVSVPVTTAVVPTLPGIRKRVASTSHADLQAESIEHELKTSTSPKHKKPRGLEQQEDNLEQSSTPENIETGITPQENESRETDNFHEASHPSKEESSKGASDFKRMSELEESQSRSPYVNKSDDSNVDGLRETSEVPENTEGFSSLSEHNERKTDEITPADQDQTAPVTEASDTIEKNEVSAKEEGAEELGIREPSSQENTLVISETVMISETVKEQEVEASGIDLDNNMQNSTLDQFENTPSNQMAINSEKGSSDVSSKDPSEGFHLSNLPQDVEEGEFLGGETDVAATMDIDSGNISVQLQDDVKHGVEGEDAEFLSEDVLEERDPQQAEYDQSDKQGHQIGTGMPSQLSCQSPEHTTSERLGADDEKVEVSPSNEAGNEPTRTNTTINLTDRARVRGALRRERGRGSGIPSAFPRERARRNVKRGGRGR